MTARGHFAKTNLELIVLRREQSASLRQRKQRSRNRPLVSFVPQHRVTIKGPSLRKQLRAADTCRIPTCSTPIYAQVLARHSHSRRLLRDVLQGFEQVSATAAVKVHRQDLLPHALAPPRRQHVGERRLRFAAVPRPHHRAPVAMVIIGVQQHRDGRSALDRAVGPALRLLEPELSIGVVGSPGSTSGRRNASAPPGPCPASRPGRRPGPCGRRSAVRPPPAGRVRHRREQRARQYGSCPCGRRGPASGAGSARRASPAAGATGCRVCGRLPAGASSGSR